MGAVREDGGDAGAAAVRALEGLRRALAELGPLPEREWARLSRSVEVGDHPRKGFLLRQGEEVDRVGFLGRGLVRYLRVVRGREVTLGFDREGRFVGDYEAFATGAPARVSVQALEDCSVVELPRALQAELEAGHACWSAIFRRLLERRLLARIDKELRIRTRTPSERYRELVGRGSYLVKRVPQYHLASYLGIAPRR